MNETELKEKLIEFINNEMKRMGNTDVHIENIRLWEHPQIDAFVDVSFTWYLNGVKMPRTLTDTIFMFREGKWHTPTIFSKNNY